MTESFYESYSEYNQSCNNGGGNWLVAKSHQFNSRKQST